MGRWETHPGGVPEVTIPYVEADQIELDGKTTDWSDLLGPPLLTASQFHLWEGDKSHREPAYVVFTPEDLDFHIWMGWSQPGRIFVAAEFQDDEVLDDPAPIFVRSDGIYLSVAPEHREEWEGQFYAVRPKWIKPYPYVGNDEVWSTRAPFSDGAWSEQTSTLWAVEFFISCFDVMNGPDDHVVSDLAAGDEISLIFGVNDYDSEGYKYANFNLYSDHTVRALLLSPDQTAVQRRTWGQVKAGR